MTDYYALLGVAHTASGEEIRRAWKKMARRYHPDVSDHPEAAREFLLRKTAYDVLSDPNKRARYDREHDRAGAKASRSDRTQEKRGSWTPVDSLIFSWVIMGEDGWPFLDRKGLAGYVRNAPPSVNQLVRERCYDLVEKGILTAHADEGNPFRMAREWVEAGKIFSRRCPWVEFWKKPEETPKSVYPPADPATRARFWRETVRGPASSVRASGPMTLPEEQEILLVLCGALFLGGQLSQDVSVPAWLHSLLSFVPGTCEVLGGGLLGLGLLLSVFDLTAPRRPARERR